MSRWHATDFDFYPEQAFRPRPFGGMTFEGGKGGSAPAPDPNIGLYYQKMGDIAGEVWSEARGLMPLQRQQMEFSLDAARQAQTEASADRQYALGRRTIMDNRYDNVVAPLLNQTAADSKLYNSAAEQERLAQEAGEDVAGAFAQNEGQMQRGLQARGVRADSGAAIAAMNSNKLTQAMAQASAVNMTRQAAKEMGWKLADRAIAANSGMPAYGMAAQGAATGATGAGYGYGTAGLGLTNSAIGGINSAGAGASNIYGSAAGGLNSLYGNQVSAYNAQQQNDPFNTILGAVTGAGFSKMISDRRLKEDIRRVGTLDNGIPIYTYRYRGSNVHVMGVIADEVKHLQPEAYVKGGFDGHFDAVDYSKLGD